MMKSVLVIALLIAATVLAVSAAHADKRRGTVGRAPAPAPTVTRELLDGGRLTRLTLRGRTHHHRSNQKQLLGAKKMPILGGGDDAATALPDPTLTNPPLDQPTSMVFVITDTCNNALELVPSSVAIENGGWVPLREPPGIIPSAWDGWGAGFEAQVNPGQAEPSMNGTLTYRMRNTTGLNTYQIYFALSFGEWMLETIAATVWHPKIFSSEIDDKGDTLNIALYHLGLGTLNIFDPAIC